MKAVMAGSDSVKGYSTRGGSSGHTVRWTSRPGEAPSAASCDYSADEMRQALAAAVKGAAAQKRKAFNNAPPELFARNPSHEAVVAFNRDFTKPASFRAIRACPYVSIKACGGLG